MTTNDSPPLSKGDEMLLKLLRSRVVLPIVHESEPPTPPEPPELKD